MAGLELFSFVAVPGRKLLDIRLDKVRQVPPVCLPACLPASMRRAGVPCKRERASHGVSQLEDVYGSPSLDDIEGFSRAFGAEFEAALGGQAGEIECMVSSPVRSTDRQTDGQTDRRTDGRTDGQTGRQADERTDRRAGRQTDWWTDGQAGSRSGWMDKKMDRLFDRLAGKRTVD
jgi:hypothetical protein